jgi:branched-chain amino acid transport system ATP-binding protein
MILEVKQVHTYYGKSHVLQGVSLALAPGEIVCLLGRNGVGKTTTLKSIMGMLKPRAGSILFRGRELLGKEPYQIARIGIGIVPEERRIFASLNVHENLLIGIKSRRPPRRSGALDWTIDKIYESFPRLYERRESKGGHLSGGEQQMLTVARTLMGNPELLLVDEPTEGLAPLIVKVVLETLATIRDAGVTILLVEQNFKAAMKLATRFYIMGKGMIVFAGDAPALQAAEEVRKQYLEL